MDRKLPNDCLRTLLKRLQQHERFYNSIVSPSTGSINTLEEVLSPDSGFWNNQQSPAISSVLDTLSWDGKKDIIQAYLLVKRSEEELSLLAEEKCNTLAYWGQQRDLINKHITSTTEDSSTQYSAGSIALLKKLLREVETHYSTIVALFGAASIIITDDDLSSDNDSDLDSLGDYEQDVDIYLLVIIIHSCISLLSLEYIYYNQNYTSHVFNEHNCKRLYIVMHSGE